MKKLLFGLILIFPAYCGALNLGEIETQVRLHIKDSNTSRQNYTDTQLDNLINQAHRDVVNLTWCIQKNTSITLVEDTTSYALPTDLIQISRVTFENENLEENTLAGLDGKFTDSDWETVGGYPEYYYINPATPDYISIQPWPDSSSSTGTLSVNYYAMANTLDDDADEPFNGDDRLQQYSDILVWYPVYQICIIEGRVDKAQYYQGLYESRIAYMLDKLGQKTNYFPSFGGQRK